MTHLKIKVEVENHMFLHHLKITFLYRKGYL